MAYNLRWFMYMSVSIAVILAFAKISKILRSLLGFYVARNADSMVH